MSLYIPSSPHLHPPPPPRAIFFDIEAAILETREFYKHHPATTGNATQGPMPRHHSKPRPVGGSNDPPSTHAKFSLPFPSQLLLKIGDIIFEIAMAFIALSLPWLAATQLNLLAKAVPARADNPLAMTTVSGEQWKEIELHSSLSCDLQMAISERREALAEVERVTNQAMEEGEKALEREYERDESPKELGKERDEALEDLVRGREDMERLEKEKNGEAERLKEETKQQVKTWEEKERDWEEKERDWEKKRRREEGRHEEDEKSLKMGRERERERDSWAGQVERLEGEKKEWKEDMDARIKKILEERELERKRWEREREEWEKEKEEGVREKGKLEAEREAERKNWAEENNRAQERIISLEARLVIRLPPPGLRRLPVRVAPPQAAPTRPEGWEPNPPERPRWRPPGTPGQLVYGGSE